MTGVFILRRHATGDIVGVYASFTGADTARAELDADEYDIESWTVLP